MTLKEVVKHTIEIPLVFGIGVAAFVILHAVAIHDILEDCLGEKKETKDRDSDSVRTVDGS